MFDILLLKRIFDDKLEFSIPLLGSFREIKHKNVIDDLESFIDFDILNNILSNYFTIEECKLIEDEISQVGKDNYSNLVNRFYEKIPEIRKQLLKYILKLYIQFIITLEPNINIILKDIDEINICTNSDSLLKWTFVDDFEDDNYPFINSIESILDLFVSFDYIGSNANKPYIERNYPGICKYWLDYIYSSKIEFSLPEDTNKIKLFTIKTIGSILYNLEDKICKFILLKSNNNKKYVITDVVSGTCMRHFHLQEEKDINTFMVAYNYYMRSNYQKRRKTLSFSYKDISRNR